MSPRRRATDRVRAAAARLALSDREPLSPRAAPTAAAPAPAAPDFATAAALVRGRAAAHPGWGATPYVPGRCPVCGSDTVFFCASLELAREAMTCPECRTTARYRSLARGLLRAIREIAGVDAPDLAALAATTSPRPFAVYDTQVAFAYANVAYPLPELLAAAPWIEVRTSRFDPAQPWGADLGAGATNQTLEALTFEDDSFDVVLTSDVLEHVRLPDRAHREIARVLKPGGAYLFTVPHTRGEPTITRVRVHDPDDPGKDEHLLEPEYHGDVNDTGDAALSYRVFGTDLDDELAALGFTVDYSRDDDPGAGIVNAELFYCRLAA